MKSSLLPLCLKREVRSFSTLDDFLWPCSGIAEEGVEVAALYDTQGWILSLMGQYEDALTALRKSFAMDSDDPSNQYHLAYTLHKLSRIPQAKNSLERALSSTRPFAERTEAQVLLTLL